MPSTLTPKICRHASSLVSMTSVRLMMPGGIDQHVDAAMLTHDLVDHLVAEGRLAHVAGRCGWSAARIVAARLLRARGIAIDDDDRRAVPGQLVGRRCAHARRAAGDDGDLADKIHRSYSPV